MILRKALARMHRLAVKAHMSFTSTHKLRARRRLGKRKNSIFIYLLSFSDLDQVQVFLSVSLHMLIHHVFFNALSMLVGFEKFTCLGYSFFVGTKR